MKPVFLHCALAVWRRKYNTTTDRRCDPFFTRDTGASIAVKYCYNLPQRKGSLMQTSDIPSTAPRDSGHQQRGLVWTTRNNGPSWKGPRPAQLPLRAGPTCQASNRFLRLLPCLVSGSPRTVLDLQESCDDITEFPDTHPAHSFPYYCYLI